MELQVLLIEPYFLLENNLNIVVFYKFYYNEGMKECKKCKNKFPNRITINEKEYYLHTRSYCLECSPFGAKKGYVLRKEETNKKNGLKNRVKRVCLICKREYNYIKNKTCSSCRAFYQRYKRRETAIEMLGGKCKNCGCEDKDVLVFHHKNKNDKLFLLSHNWSTKNWDMVLEEIKKCELLCANCHTKFHKKESEERCRKIIKWFEKSNDDNGGVAQWQRQDA